ncbi:flagellar basal body L-ring protein FlgH [Halonatronum saccharophilum]|uniref:flagellar basal body L-ring protein FlgH n=1 Tax=Halonatronum saccharophilum TaxID=150060 RepID=UPI0004B2D3DA|nr:flagellar basal body L-ring protein FlgH [Halonatronum saccharophilum]
MFKRERFFKLLCPVILILTVVCIGTGVGEATSLWNDSGSLFSDNKANDVGDLLTIIITEDSTASQEATTDSSQGTNVNVGAGNGILDFITAFGVNQDDSVNAAGSTSRSSSLSASVTVQITEVLDNGNLMVSGERSINVNDETQTIKLTGVVRPQDITPQNTIDSTYIADVDIEYHGQGVVGDRQSPGIITRILNWFF